MGVASASCLPGAGHGLSPWLSRRCRCCEAHGLAATYGARAIVLRRAANHSANHESSILVGLPYSNNAA